MLALLSFYRGGQGLHTIVWDGEEREAFPFILFHILTGERRTLIEQRAIYNQYGVSRGWVFHRHSLTLSTLFPTASFATHINHLSLKLSSSCGLFKPGHHHSGPRRPVRSSKIIQLVRESSLQLER
jgi:hypothetical protein